MNDQWRTEMIGDVTDRLVKLADQLPTLVEVDQTMRIAALKRGSRRWGTER